MHHVIEDIIHGSFICGSNILNIKRHDPIAIGPQRGGDGYLMLIFGTNQNFAVVKKTIHKGKHLIPYGIFNLDIMNIG